ncbi:MAG: ABC transporter ATP-binding protein [Coriobacteriia bacterium]|nr:ABC transporter ATP-binding protein [Coriobacteriia bacterium]MBN2821998.1 ABC transporter ATP-binding protein [Coriobacteriia bacterium]
MSDRTPLILAEGISQKYRRRTVLDVDRFDVAEGETHALLGPSGAGKSTLLRIVGLLEKPTTGRVTIEGRPVTHRSRPARMMMAAVFQKPYLFNGTVAENVAYGLKLRGVPSAERDRRVRETVSRVGLDELADASALTLSGGEAQRVALARALVLDPRILLLDEPLSYLDPLIKRQLVAEFSRILHDSGVTTVYVTHDQDEAMVVADRLSIMHEGCFVRSGPVDEVMGLPTNEWLADFIGMEAPIFGRVAAIDEGVARIDCGGVSVYAITSLPVGSDVVVGVRPEDVTLFQSNGLPVSSARNILHCTVEAIEPRGATARIRVCSGALPFAASVSRASAKELQLEVGGEVIAMFKATAVRVGAAS